MSALSDRKKARQRSGQRLHTAMQWMIQWLGIAFFAAIQTADDVSWRSTPIDNRHTVSVLAYLWFVACAIPVVACFGVAAATAKTFRRSAVTGASLFFGKHSLFPIQWISKRPEAFD